MLRAQMEVQWTLFNHGWLADYFLPPRTTHLALIEGMFPIDIESWTTCIRGTGDEPQSWTAARDVGAAVAELCRATHDWVSEGPFPLPLESRAGCIMTKEY